MDAPHPFASRRYAEALAGPAEVLRMPEWGSHLIRRAIPGGGADAAGVYPLQVFARGADLAAGLDALRRAELVCAVMVPDPLLHPTGELSRVFDICSPFKIHQLIDTALGPFAPSKHHRDRIRRGHRRCRVDRVELVDHLETWRALYAGLAARRGITGVAAFSGRYFRGLADTPGLTAFAAFVDGACVGMTLWFAAEGVVYNHLTASSAAGNANGANYALYDAAIAHFAGCGVVNLGGNAGLSDAEDGLAAFKRGFANSQVEARICGAILDPARYAALSACAPESAFFPAYRAPVAAAVAAARAA